MNYAVTSILSTDIADVVKSEYKILISLGYSSEEVENILLKLLGITKDKRDENEISFWLSIANEEWKHGRITDRARDVALSFLNDEKLMVPWYNPSYRRKTLDELKIRLNSPQPSPSNVKPPRSRICPWRVGSLLAYRIITNDALKNDPCYGKYALLRVVKIQKRPISYILPDEFYEEGIFVALYGWIGDTIPDYSITQDLKYIPFSTFTLSPNIDKYLPIVAQRMGIDIESEPLSSLRDTISAEIVDKMVYLVWNKSKKLNAHITYLGIDEAYQEKLPEYFSSCKSGYSLYDYNGLDRALSEALKDMPADK